MFAPLAVRYAEEAKKHDNYPLDIEHTIANAGRTVISEDGCLLLAYLDNEPVGLLWAHCHSLPWSKSKLAFDTILYVVPEHRKSRAGYKLMKHYEVWSKGCGAVECQISIASGITEEATINFYNRLGYRLVGSQYRKEL